MSIGIESDAFEAEPRLGIAAGQQFVDDPEEERTQLPLDQSLVGTDGIEDEPAGEWFDEEKRGGAGGQSDFDEAESLRVIDVEASMGDSPQRPALFVHESVDVIRDR
ncbi:hypothetical protein BAU01nite_20730 [Brevibacterium aurantiacum]|nr:hypothetical protein BAU01nite_20730 [Brevibacterium aurantiacum]